MQIMAKQFNQALSEWLDDFHSTMTVEKRADMNEVIVNVGYDNQIIENHGDLIKVNLTNLVSLYHILNRYPKKFKSLIELLKPEDNE